ncbi:VPA1269 family protein [Acinetobacter pittii]|uniref:gamma-mobile-trio integrase GmtZ n=1 Tax=Acinetobacter pittii TaxID=48296 RepID=UPI003AF693F4
MKYSNCLLLRSELNVSDEIYQKLTLWNEQANIWLENNKNKEKIQALRIFINKFLLNILDKYIDLNNFFLMDLHLIDINKILDDLLCNLSDKNKFYYRSIIMFFLDDLSRQYEVINVFYQSYLLKWGRCNLSNQWENELHYIFEWKDIDQNFFLEFSKEVYFFLNESEGCENFKDIIMNGSFSNKRLTILFKDFIKDKTYISISRKNYYRKKFSEFIGWVVNHFPEIKLDENIKEQKEFLIYKFGEGWRGIQEVVDKWLLLNKNNSKKFRSSLKRFFYNSFVNGDNEKKFNEIFNCGVNINLIELMKINNNCNEVYLRIQCTHVISFFNWYVDSYGGEKKIVNPFIIFSTKNPFYSFLVCNGTEWNSWLILATQWLSEHPKGRLSKIHAIRIFLNCYVKNIYKYHNLDFFLDEVQCENVKYSTIIDLFRTIDNINVIYYSELICTFINWIVEKSVPKSRAKKIYLDSKKFNWILVDYGNEWLEWVQLAEEWLNISKKNISHKKQAIKLFFINFLLQTPTYGNVELFFKGDSNWKLKEEIFQKKLLIGCSAALKLKAEYYAVSINFLDWVILERFSNSFSNPLTKKNYIKNKPIFLLFSNLGEKWLKLGILLEEWINQNPKINRTKLYTPIKIFFNYLNEVEKIDGNIDNLINLTINKGNFNREKYYNYLNSFGYTKNTVRFYVKWPSQFLDYLVSQEIKENYFNPLSVTIRTDDLRKWFTHSYGIDWKIWCNYAEQWLSNYDNRIVRTSIIIFFENYLLNRPCKSNVELFYRGVGKWIPDIDDFKDSCKNCTNVTFKTYFHYIKKFTFWVFNCYLSKLRYEKILPPFGKVVRNLKNKNNKFQWLVLEYGQEWSEWANCVNKWILSIQKGQSSLITSLSRFFEYYLVSFPNGYVLDNVFFSQKGVLIDKDIFIKMLKTTHDSHSIQKVISDCVKFLDWVIKNNYKNSKVKVLNPFGSFRIKDGRTKDLEFKWFVNLYGVQWEDWRSHTAEWMATQNGSLSQRIRSMSLFLESYLARTHPEAYLVESFFSGELSFYPKNEELYEIIKTHTNIKKEANIKLIINHIVSFFDWALSNYYSVENSHGFLIPKYSNPFVKEKSSRILYESIHTPLPYHYIRSLIKKLCPNDFGNFKDWSWAYSTVNKKVGGGWFDIPHELIDFDDLDCVWRKVTIKGKYPIKAVEKYQIWSPVAAIGVYLKLHLPLRTYQTRMLDSGEADEERYENGKWIKNPNKFVIPRLAKGVFKKITEYSNNETYTGFYINTNKTADINKSASEKGYVIPWENKVVLYWLEKLRNWQEKYNPISYPTSCSSLKTSHLGQIVAQETLKEMGNISFLLRHAAAKKDEDKEKPILDSTLNGFWLRLLIDFENDIAKEGQTFSDGSRIKFVDISPNSKRLKYYPLFPLHSLRVSFITSYLQDGKVPLPILSKLLAGHSSLLMTLYYAKISPNHMQTIITDAQDKMENNSKEDLKLFLRDHDINEINKSMVFQDKVSIAAILQGRNILGWEQKHHGICLAAGNTLDIRDSYDSTRNAGCWNGGRPSEIEDKKQSLNKFEPVPHGAGNCVRCRWFITHASYLPQLVAHFNILSYKANLSAIAARKANESVLKLEKLKQTCLQEGKLFGEEKSLERFLKEYKLELSEADEYCKDIIATLNIIERINIQENNRGTHDESQKVIAVGNQEDIEFAFLETKSELLHLCILCDDAEVYPDLYNQLSKTPAIERRTRLISKMMLKKGYQPHYLFLSDEEQFRVINSMIREMSKHMNKLDRFDSFKLLVERLEQESSYSVKGILDEFLDRDENKYIKLIDIMDADED